jgi:hypothetical protein
MINKITINAATLNLSSEQEQLVSFQDQPKPTVCEMLYIECVSVNVIEIINYEIRTRCIVPFPRKVVTGKVENRGKLRVDARAIETQSYLTIVLGMKIKVH